MESAISVSGLTKYYGDFLAVDHISFEVRQGEIFGFLGPNGAGKTTTIRMLTGISELTEGPASIIGYDIVEQSVETKSMMGIVPDISDVYEELTAWENLVFIDNLYGLLKRLIEERAESPGKKAKLIVILDGVAAQIRALGGAYE